MSCAIMALALHLSLYLPMENTGDNKQGQDGRKDQQGQGQQSGSQSGQGTPPSGK